MNLNLNNKSKIKKFLTFGVKKNPTRKGRTREFLAKLSKGLMLPIAMLPVAGLLLGIGATISSQAANQGILGLETFGNILRIAGDVIFGALPVLFAIAIAIAFTKDAGAAGLSAFIGYLVFAALQMSLLIPVRVDGQIIGFNLLFYTNGTLGELSANFGIPSSIVTRTLGITQLNTSVFGGLIVGFIVVYLYNKFINIQLPTVIGFFSGVRFIPIVTFAAVFPLAIITMIIWPLVGTGLTYFGNALGSNLLGFNSFIFGYIERALVPFGLHHAFYLPLWQTSVGGSLFLGDLAIVNGSFVDVNEDGIRDTWLQVAASFGSNIDNEIISGDQVIWAYVNSNFAGRDVNLLGGGSATIIFSDFTSTVYNGHLNTLLAGQTPSSGGINIGQYMQGKYSFMMFGLPAAAVAMIMTVPKENRKASISLVGAAGFTSLLTGITEPIEFTFLFLAPWLFWGFHAIMAAFSFGLMNWIGLIFPDVAPHIGQTFSGGLLDWIIFGALQEGGGSNSWWALVFGVVYVPIYYFVFYWAIKRFDLATPGRKGITKLTTKKDYLNQKDAKLQINGGSSDIQNFDINAIEIIKAYGGLKNIKNVDACITKLRIEIDDQNKVNENELVNKLGAFGTIRPTPSSTYAVFGVKADYYKNKILDIINNIKNNPELEDKIFKDDDKKPVKNLEKNDLKERKSEKFNGIVKIYSPVNGFVFDITNVKDETFSKKMIGDGVAIIPSNNSFSAVIDGKISSIFHTGHAYTFQAADQSEILLHIGIDTSTVSSPEKLFKVMAKVNQKIKITDSVALVNPKLIHMKDKSVTPIIILNETLNGRKIKVVAKGNVKKGDLLFIVE